jgi:hypothetical protein
MRIRAIPPTARDEDSRDSAPSLRLAADAAPDSPRSAGQPLDGSTPAEAVLASLALQMQAVARALGRFDSASHE